MELKNHFRWSKSRSSLFSECKRKYYLRYYQHWGGWEKDAPEISRRAYRLGKMLSMPTLVGTAVHEVLARHFQALRTGQFRELKPESPVGKMRQVWRNAKNELWKDNPKRFPPLFELYYQRVPADEELQAFAEAARRAISNLKRLSLYQKLRALPKPDFLWIDPAHEKFSEETCFEVPPFEAISAPDLVYRGEEKTVILDWKTGSKNENDHRQMSAAALWAHQRLGCGWEELKASLIYLASGEVNEFQIDGALAARAEEMIRTDMEAMSGYLADPRQNIPLDRESFPRHNNPKFCWYCEFQEICSGDMK